MQLSERLVTPGSDHTFELTDNIMRKQELLCDGDPAHKSIRTALVIGSGAMRGVYSGGVVIGLEELGLTQAFDHVIGVSAGAATAAYFLAGQAKLGTSIYYEDLASKEFIDRTRIGNPLNIDFLDEVFTARKPLDRQSIQDNRSLFHIGVTDVNKVQAEYIRANHNTGDNIIKLVQASSSVPGLTPPIMIDGTLYGDGITTCKNPVGFAIDTLGCTDILFVVNQPLRLKDSISVGEKSQIFP